MNTKGNTLGRDTNRSSNDGGDGQLALIQCPDCHGKVGEAAPGCPHCGCVLTLELIVAQKEIRQQAERNLEEAVLQTARKDELLKALAFGGALILFIAGHYVSPATSGSSTYDNKQAMAIAEAKSFVTSHLKSPSSASFPWFDGYSATHFADGTWAVSGYVEAANSFNAKIKTPWFVRLKDTGADWQLMSINIAD